MNKYDVEEYACYCVYEILNDKVHYICVCDSYKDAETIAYLLAKADKDNDPYYITSVNYPGDLVPGGGWYDSFKKNADGKIERSSLD